MSMSAFIAFPELFNSSFMPYNPQNHIVLSATPCQIGDGFMF